MVFGFFFHVVTGNVEQFLYMLNLLEVLILWKMKNDVCGEKKFSGAHFLLFYTIIIFFFYLFQDWENTKEKMKIFITYRDMP